MPPGGTFDCPTCGQNAPHEHSGEDVAKYRYERVCAGLAAEKELREKSEAEREEIAGCLATEQDMRGEVINTLRTVQTELAQLKSDHDEWIEREAACCPEDTPFDVMIDTLRAELSKAQEVRDEALTAAGLRLDAAGMMSHIIGKRNDWKVRCVAAEDELSALKKKLDGK